MNNYRTIPKLLNLFLCCCVLLGLGASAGGALYGQASTQEKIRLMSDALAARDAGDLEAARDHLRELLELNPGDAGVQRLLDNVERTIEAQEAPEPTPEPAPEPERAPEPVEPRAETPEASPATEPGLIQDQVRVTDRETEQLKVLMDEANALRAFAVQQAADGDYEQAITVLEQARRELPRNQMTADQHRELDYELGEIYLGYARQQLRDGNLEEARAALDAYALVAPDGRAGQRLERELLDPAYIPIEEASPGFVADQEKIRDLIRIGRAQYLNGDILGAESTFREVETVDVYNAEAKAMLARIAQEKSRRNHLDRTKTRAQMLEEVGLSWQRPGKFVVRPEEPPAPIKETELERKLSEIKIPSVNFAGVELSRAVNTLSQISAEYDPEAVGVNIVPMDPDRTEPLVYINVRDLSLKRILDLMVDSVNFQYQVEEDAVIVRPGVRRRPDLETENFPVSPATVQRLMGRSAPQATETAQVDDPFAAPAAPEPSAQAPSAGGGAESRGLREFLQQAGGVDFTVQGSNLIYDGTDIWVTQTPRNLERIRNVFRRLTDVRQVEIEARFLEVAESVVDEFGFDWDITSPGGTSRYRSSNRTLAGAFAGSQATSEVRIGTDSFPVAPPTIPGGAQLGSGANNFAVIGGSIDGFDVQATIRMLSQRTGSDLLSAPKITVLSGHQANITVAQEVRYPESYGETQSEVGRGGTGDGGAAGVTITPGTPQDFQTRNVGVELTVTPTVEQDNSVTLDLNPRVTEFEGFVEYGGVALAVTADGPVTIPSGNYQPIFATREVNTRVNIWDGATVVMGGLTREEVKRVRDKVPVFGDIPVFGRLFRSEGEGSQKRNLLVFVTANLVSPGGSPMRQEVRSVEAGSLFQNPTIVLPSGAVAREKRIE